MMNTLRVDRQSIAEHKMILHLMCVVFDKQNLRGEITSGQRFDYIEEIERDQRYLFKLEGCL